MFSLPAEGDVALDMDSCPVFKAALPSVLALNPPPPSISASCFCLQIQSISGYYKEHASLGILIPVSL